MWWFDYIDDIFLPEDFSDDQLEVKYHREISWEDDVPGWWLGDLDWDMAYDAEAGGWWHCLRLPDQWLEPDRFRRLYL